MSTLIGQSLGRYHILEQLGEGGMAIVYKAYDTRLETDVAVKVIRTENLAPSILQNALIRFEREAKALAKLTHANIVKVVDYGQYEDKPWLVMPYLPGGTLKQKLRGVPMPYQEAAQILIPIAHALAYAHQQGMVHRDVKPSNILITQSGDPMLTDFGIAKIIDLESPMDITGTSVTIGTPEYMAPEQATSKKVDHRADIYALGIVLFEMVTGRKPYQADTPMAVLFKQISEPLPRPRDFEPALPEAVERVLVKALAKQPEDRYQSMDEFAAALERLAHGDLSATAQQARPQKEITQEATMVESSPPITRTGQTVKREAKGGSGGWGRVLTFGLGGIGLVLVGICILAAIIIMARRNRASSTLGPTEIVTYVPAASRAVESPTSLPTQPPILSPVSTIPPLNQPSSTPPSCPNAKYPTRLQPDRDATICTQNERVIVRREADLNATELLSLYPGTIIHILQGPVCADDFWWWKVEVYPGTTYGLQGYSYSRTWTTNRSYTGWAREGWDNTDAYYICQ